ARTWCDGGMDTRFHRLAAAVPLLTAGALVLSGCGVFGADDTALDRFTEAFNNGDVAAAAEQTTDPAAAQETLQAVFYGVGDTEAHMDAPDGEAAQQPTGFDWTVPAGETVQTAGTVALTPDGSKVQWSPQILDTRLQPGGRIVLSDETRFTAPVVDRGGADLMHWAPVTQVTIDADNPDAAEPVAAAVSTDEPAITARQIRDAMAAEPDTPYTVVSLRDEDLAPIRDRLESVDGVQLTEQGRLITAAKNLQSPVFGELREYWRGVLDEG